jgi:AcrR family transcriptional regulator
LTWGRNTVSLADTMGSDAARGGVTQIADGRRARGERSRAAIVQAVVDLLPESDGMPSTTKVAERAGVTQRTLFRHFGSVDDLLVAVIEEQTEVIAPYLARLDDGGPRAERIARIVATRAELFARIATVRRWALQLRAAYPDIANGLRRAAVAQRAQIARLFAAELEAMDARRRAVALDAIDVALSWPTWDRLVDEQQLDDHQVVEVLAALVAGVLRDDDQ